MSPHILLVDDSLTVRMELRAALGGAGFTVKTCNTLESARKELAAHVFDLAILDIVLPDGSGIELLKQIKETPDLHSIRVIMLSTEAEVCARLQGLLLGADYYVGKPYDRGQLVRTARELLKLPEVGRATPGRRVRKKLLLIDDSPTFSSALAVTLRQDGYEVATASSGSNALALLAVEPFDIALVDLVMPGMDGLQFCRRLRTMTRQLGCLIVVMTARDPDPAIRSEALEAGADELIFKPARLSVLSAQLLCILIMKRQQLRPGPDAPEHEQPGPDTDEARRGAHLYEQVIAASGLSEVLARSLINSSFSRIGIDPTLSALITPANLQRALSGISKTLRIFLPPDESAQRLAGIAALAGAAYTQAS